jgi:hypothetical protein
MNKSPNLFSYDRYGRRLNVFGIRRSGRPSSWETTTIHRSPSGTQSGSPSTTSSLSPFPYSGPVPRDSSHARLQKEGRLLFDGRWWLHPKFRYNTATFVPQQLTPKELGEITVWANKEFYSAFDLLKVV